MDTSAPNLQRRKFLRAVATSVAVMAASQAMGGCKDEDKPDMGPKALTISIDGHGGDAGVRDKRPPDLTITQDRARADMGSRDMMQPDRSTDLVVDVPGFHPDQGILVPDKSHKE